MHVPARSRCAHRFHYKSALKPMLPQRGAETRQAGSEDGSRCSSRCSSVRPSRCNGRSPPLSRSKSTSQRDSNCTVTSCPSIGEAHSGCCRLGCAEAPRTCDAPITAVRVSTLFPPSGQDTAWWLRERTAVWMACGLQCDRGFGASRMRVRV